MDWIEKESGEEIKWKTKRNLPEYIIELIHRGVVNIWLNYWRVSTTTTTIRGNNYGIKGLLYGNRSFFPLFIYLYVFYV